MHALPLALWSLNDLPGVVSPYSPHRLVFGRDPVGFGDCPPYEVEEGHKDALEFFDQVGKERQLVQQRLTKTHEREKPAWLKKHPQLQQKVGDHVWVRFLPNEAGVHRLHRSWFGPCEVLECLSETRFLISTPKGEQILPATRLKPYVSPFKGSLCRFIIL